MLKTPYGFIPNRLEVAHKPEYSHFPLNIMFMSYRKKDDGGLQQGTALYEPDLSSFMKKEYGYTMMYWNRYSNANFIVLIYDEERGVLFGKKIVNKECVAEVEAHSWQAFFVQLTRHGLSNGETCEFDDAR